MQNINSPTPTFIENLKESIKKNIPSLNVRIIS